MIDEKIAKWLGVDAANEGYSCINGILTPSLFPPYSSNMQYTMQVLNKLRVNGVNTVFIEMYKDSYVVRIGTCASAIGYDLAHTICTAVCELYNL